ncbi:MAG: sigma-70 family RNA polymerase sigma factor [Candidatus Eisenbacteria bacterium]
MEEIRSDEQLVRDLQADPDGPAGRRAASELLKRWRSRVFAWCYHLVRERERSMELAQDCLVSIHRALPAFEARAQVGSWIYTVVRNRCLSELRRRRIERLDDEVHEPVDGAPGPDEAWQWKSSQEQVLQLMRAHLDERERLALWLRAYEELPVERITELMGLDSASGARGLLQTARRKLKAALQRRANGEGLR